MNFQLALFLLLISPLSLLADDPAIRVAVFEGEGMGQSFAQLIESLGGEGDRKIQVSRITPAEIQSGKLAEVDVLVHPGGSGSKQGKALWGKGRTAVRDFVDEGAAR